MGLEKLTLASLDVIDGGRLREAFEAALKVARLDCYDRPRLDSARKVLLSISLTPVARQDGTLSSIEVQFEVDNKTPKKVSPSFDMLPEQGGLFFNEMSPDDVRQGTLDQAGGKPKGVVTG